MDNEQIKENLSNMAGGSVSKTPQAALDRINTLERALHKVAYWLDTDEEILDSMSPDERAAHVNLHRLVLEALF